MFNICQNCQKWKRRTLYKVNHENMVYRGNFWEEWEDRPPEGSDIILETCNSKFGECNCKKFIYTQAGGCVEDDDIANEDQPDALLYTDGEAYGAYFLTGENFGCVHFKEIL